GWGTVSRQGTNHVSGRGEVIEGEGRTAAAAAPVALGLLHALDEIDLGPDPRVERVVRHGVREELEAERRDAAAAPDRVLDVALGSRLGDLWRKLSARIAARNPPAAREGLRGGRQQLRVTRVAAALLDERRAGLLEEVQPLLRRGAQRGLRDLVRGERGLDGDEASEREAREFH